MALPADFSKIFGSTATGGLTPIGDVNYAKGWEFVGSTPPTKNDFSYLQNLSDLKSQWLYSNKLQRTNPFADIKADGTVNAALANLGLGTAAKKDVGTGVGQIPDMSAWRSGGDVNNGWRKSPDGFIEQWGRATVSSNTSITFTIPFPNEVHTIMATGDPSYSNGIEVAQAWPVSNTKFKISGGWALAGNSGPATNMITLWRAWGR